MKSLEGLMASYIGKPQSSLESNWLNTGNLSEENHSFYFQEDGLIWSRLSDGKKLDLELYALIISGTNQLELVERSEISGEEETYSIGLWQGSLGLKGYEHVEMLFPADKDDKLYGTWLIIDNPHKYSIEHIMPRSGQNIAQIREDAGIVDNDEFLEVINKLGNKVILEENINRSVGNAWFRTKIQNYVKDKMGYKDSIFALPSSVIRDFEGIENPLWTVRDINDHTRVTATRISSFICEDEVYQ